MEPIDQLPKRFLLDLWPVRLGTAHSFCSLLWPLIGFSDRITLNKWHLRWSGKCQVRVAYCCRPSSFDRAQDYKILQSRLQAPRKVLHFKKIASYNRQFTVYIKWVGIFKNELESHSCWAKQHNWSEGVNLRSNGLAKPCDRYFETQLQNVPAFGLGGVWTTSAFVKWFLEKTVQKKYFTFWVTNWNW